MRRCLSLLVIAGCATTSTAPKATHEAAGGNAETSSASDVPKPRFDVVPAELGDANVLDRIHARVIVRRWDVAYLRADGEMIGTPNTSSDDSYDVYDVVPVIDSEKKIRIVVQDDGARLAVWIARETAQTTVLARSTIGTDAIGVTLWPGAPLSLQQKTARGRELWFKDHMLSIRKALPAERLGYVFVAPPDAPAPSLGPPSSRSWSPPKDRRERVLVSPGMIRAEPSANAEELATVLEETIATRAGERDGWIEIELHRPFVRVRGFVEAKLVKPDDGRTAHTTGGGHGFGVSHSVTHVLPAGTCLYERVNGEVIGTTLEARSRIGGSVAEQWAMVYVDTTWGAQKLFIKDLGDDPTTPQWETCTEDVHRR